MYHRMQLVTEQQWQLWQRSFCTAKQKLTKVYLHVIKSRQKVTES